MNILRTSVALAAASVLFVPVFRLAAGLSEQAFMPICLVFLLNKMVFFILTTKFIALSLLKIVVTCFLLPPDSTGLTTQKVEFFCSNRQIFSSKKQVSLKNSQDFLLNKTSLFI